MQSRMRQCLIAVTILLRAISSAQQAPPSDDALAYLGRLPFTFEMNRGQTSPQVKFLSRGEGYTAFLTAEGLTLSLHPLQPAADEKGTLAGGNVQSSSSATVQFRLVGAAANPRIVGENPEPGMVNYFFGKDPSKWHTRVPTYRRVRYQSVYPGIDLVYYGNTSQLEYDFEVHPGSDPSRIQFEIRGAAQTSLDPDGNLVLTLQNTQLRFQRPAVYQQVGAQRIAVDGSYFLTDSTHVQFEVPHYDSSQPLVIDPVLVYSTYVGGTGVGQATGIAVDRTGRVYLSG